MDKKHFDIDFRAATLKDFEECMDLINQARQQMVESGLHQWTGGYPSESDILADINNGVAQVLTIDKKMQFMELSYLTGKKNIIVSRVLGRHMVIIMPFIVWQLYPNSKEKVLLRYLLKGKRTL